MTTRPVADIHGFHAHVYYDADSKPAAAALRESIAENFDVALGRWHDQPIGPHPTGSYQVAFRPDQFGEFVPWLALNRRGLVILVHPDTGDDVADHTGHALWLGDRLPLDIDKLR